MVCMVSQLLVKTGHKVYFFINMYTTCTVASNNNYDTPGFSMRDTVGFSNIERVLVSNILYQKQVNEPGQTKIEIG